MNSLDTVPETVEVAARITTMLDIVAAGMILTPLAMIVIAAVVLWVRWNNR